MMLREETEMSLLDSTPIDSDRPNTYREEKEKKDGDPNDEDWKNPLNKITVPTEASQSIVPDSRAEIKTKNLENRRTRMIQTMYIKSNRCLFVDLLGEEKEDRWSPEPKRSRTILELFQQEEPLEIKAYRKIDKIYLYTY